MLPTIPQHHPLILLNTLHHRRGKSLSVGDVVVFKHPILVRSRACKRIVGMPGDFVSVVTPARTEVERRDLEEGARVAETMVQVPEGHCWVAGDNLDWSRDSRVFGPVPLALVVGKVEAVVWPWGDMGWVWNRLTDYQGEGERDGREWARPTK